LKADLEQKRPEVHMRRRDPYSFDPVVVGNRETDAWAAYYRREWGRFLVAAVAMVREGLGMGPLRTLLGAWHVLRANQVWAPVPDNDPEAARASMRRFYALVARTGDLDFDPAQAARLEVEWWRLHRAHHYQGPVDGSQLQAALVELYSYVYDAKPSTMKEAARWRVLAMEVSDRWAAAGCDLDDPLLLEERRSLVASYGALRDAAERDAEPQRDALM
jgi:hypothetical protein